MDKDKQSSKTGKQSNYNPSDDTKTYGTSKNGSTQATQVKGSYDSTKNSQSTDCK